MESNCRAFGCKERVHDGTERSSLPNGDLGTFRIRPANDLLKVNRARASRFLCTDAARKGQPFAMCVL